VIRSFEERKEDALAILSAPAADAWVATASDDGTVHLVPLSIGWTGDRIVLVTLSRSPTVRNLAATRRTRAGLGGTRDVVMVDAELAGDHPLADAPSGLVETFANQSGWDPRDEPDVDAYRVLELRPTGIQAWREANELAGRTLMRDGAWLAPSSPSGGS
jgi:hypothetical protein